MCGVAKTSCHSFHASVHVGTRSSEASHVGLDSAHVSLLRHLLVTYEMNSVCAGDEYFDSNT